MEKKEFREYTKEEQKELLLHWWAYMDTIPYSLVDIKNLEELININPRAIFRAAFASDCPDRAFNKQAILRYLEHYAYFKEYEHFFDVSEYFAKEFLSKGQMDEFLGRIVDSYNSKKTIVPLVRECTFVDDYSSISNEEAMKLSGKRVRSIFSDCVIKDIDKEWLDVYNDFTIGQGINEPASVFRTSSLNEHREEIAECIEMLPLTPEDTGVSILNLGYNKYGREWASNFAEVDMLIRLGVASELLYFHFPKNEWNTLPGEKPFIASSSISNKNCTLKGHSPETYEDVVKEYKKKLG